MAHDLACKTKRSGQWIKKINFNFPMLHNGEEEFEEICFDDGENFPTLANTSEIGGLFK